MKRISSLLIGLLFNVNLFAQVIHVDYALKTPKLDGYIEVDEWGSPVGITKVLGDELPTVTSEWYSSFDTDNFYLAIIVNDDSILTGDEAGGADSLYDHIEVFFDVNTEDLKDGMGPADAGSGHYRFVGLLKEGYDGITITESPEGQNPGGTYVYTLGPNFYMYEIAFPWANFKDKTGISIVEKLESGGFDLGFDVVIFDQDEGATTKLQRIAWMNNDLSKPDWENMDEAGRIRFPWLDYDYWGPMLNLSSHHLTLSANAESVDSITVKPDYDFLWNAYSNQTWLVVDPKSYTGNGTLTVTASENKGAARTATVTFDWVGNRSAELIVTQTAAGVGITKMDREEIRTYPNPATDRITIQGGIDSVELFNSQGIKVKELEIKKGSFSVGDLPVGVYILKAYKKGNFARVAKIFKN
jgi:hypothetical protein